MTAERASVLNVLFRRVSWLVLGFAGWSLACRPALMTLSQPPGSAKPQLPLVFPVAQSTAQPALGVAVLSRSEWQVRARGVVLQYFQAISKESLEGLSLVLLKEASMTSSSGETTERVLALWQSRFRRYDYREGSQPHQGSSLAIGLFTKQQVEALRPLRRFALPLSTGSYLAEVQLPFQSLQGPRPTGANRPERLEFALRSTAEGWRIERVFEDHGEGS